jgi:molybdate transport system ATP-binding protein
MSLEAAIELRLGRLELALALRVEPGEVVALAGPNGAGKTTTLRALAGLLRLDRGRIALSGRALDDPAAGAFVEPWRRRVGMVFQEHRLFPHLSALANVAFGLEAQGRPRALARRRAAEWLAAVDLADHAESRPTALSGGQAQKVALARALASEPDLLLLDEPLAALDPRAREEMQALLNRHLAVFAGPCLIVTHDRGDAAALASRTLRLEAGRLVTPAGFEPAFSA